MCVKASFRTRKFSCNCLECILLTVSEQKGESHEPMKMQCVLHAKKCTRSSRDWLEFCFLLVKKFERFFFFF